MFKFWWVEIKDNQSGKIFSDEVFAFKDGTAGQVFRHYLKGKYKNQLSDDLTISVSKNKPQTKSTDGFNRI